MKIATFNINDINKRLANLLDWLRSAKPDVVCLQELKAADRDFPKAAIEKAGYSAATKYKFAPKAASPAASAAPAPAPVPVSTSVTLF